MLGGEGESSAYSSAKDAADNKRASPAVDGDEPAGNRYPEHGPNSDRFYIPPTISKQSPEAANPCSFIPYTPSGAVYPPSGAARYSSSLHLGSVLPPAGYSPSAAGRSHFSASYQHGQNLGCIYNPYTASGSALSNVAPPGTGPGMRAQVYLCNRPLWLKFHRHQTEMIITKQGRRMFPFLSFNIAGLNVSAHYNVFVEVVLADPNHWRFQGGKWVTCGKADNNNQGMVVLQSLHKYQPRLHIVEVTEDGVEDINSDVKTQCFTMYTAPDNDRLTPSPTDSPRAHQIVPGTRYTMQPLFQDQLVNNLPQNRFYNCERAVPQTSSLLSPQTEDGASQRWFVTSMQQGVNSSTSSSKLELTPYEGEYSSSLLPYGIKSLSMQTTHALSYYPDSPFTTMSAGWGSRAAYQRKVPPSLPWSPRPSPTAGFPEESVKVKPQIQDEVSGSDALISSWTETQSSVLSPSKADSFSIACKRRRLSLNGPSTEDSPANSKCEELAAATISSPYSKEPPATKSMSYYPFYTNP
ncbi:hypothetical protein GOODEAATRI_023207 [Goodea atripinnis]|uniref:T-box domain-containing protein n=1 Tax=Goodea atripinnis TaxID=208336 RepID=A0ABV0NCZ1_9TELE